MAEKGRRRRSDKSMASPAITPCSDIGQKNKRLHGRRRSETVHSNNRDGFHVDALGILLYLHGLDIYDLKSDVCSHRGYDESVLSFSNMDEWDWEEVSNDCQKDDITILCQDVNVSFQDTQAKTSKPTSKSRKRKQRDASESELNCQKESESLNTFCESVSDDESPKGSVSIAALQSSSVCNNRTDNHRNTSAYNNSWFLNIGSSVSSMAISNPVCVECINDKEKLSHGADQNDNYVPPNYINILGVGTYPMSMPVSTYTSLYNGIGSIQLWSISLYNKPRITKLLFHKGDLCRSLKWIENPSLYVGHSRKYDDKDTCRRTIFLKTLLARRLLLLAALGDGCMYIYSIPIKEFVIENDTIDAVKSSSFLRPTWAYKNSEFKITCCDRSKFVEESGICTLNIVAGTAEGAVLVWKINERLCSVSANTLRPDRGNHNYAPVQLVVQSVPIAPEMRDCDLGYLATHGAEGRRTERLLHEPVIADVSKWAITCCSFIDEDREPCLYAIGDTNGTLRVRDLRFAFSNLIEFEIFNQPLECVKWELSGKFILYGNRNACILNLETTETATLNTRKSAAAKSDADSKSKSNREVICWDCATFKSSVAFCFDDGCLMYGPINETHRKHHQSLTVYKWQTKKINSDELPPASEISESRSLMCRFWDRLKNRCSMQRQSIETHGIHVVKMPFNDSHTKLPRKESIESLTLFRVTASLPFANSCSHCIEDFEPVFIAYGGTCGVVHVFISM